MKNLLKNRTALSTVVTTLIILVVSVLLAGVVTYFAINVVSTRVQQESLNLTYQHVWYSTTDSAPEVAILITNTGGRDVVLQTVAVRGQSVPSGNIFYYSVSTPVDLPYVPQTNYMTNTTGFPATFPPTTPSFTPVTSSVVLASGKTIALYIFSSSTPTFTPGSVTVNDVGTTIAISIFTAQATYYKETNVQASS